MTRTDVHAPGSSDFDPESYTLVDVYDLHPESHDHRELSEAIEELAKRGVHQAPHAMGCGHCGQTNLRYVALLVREDVQEWIFVGQDCLVGRFTGMTKARFAELRKAAELERAKQAVKTAWLAFCAANPAMAWASYADNIEIGIERDLRDLNGQKVLGRDAKYLGTSPEDHRMASGVGFHTNVMRDIARKARRYGSASAKQVAFVEKLLGEIETKVADYRTKIAARIEAPTVPALTVGRQVVEGVVLGFKSVENDYSPYGGTILKMIVQIDGGQRVYGTVPAAIDPGKGDRVRFTATVERSDDEPDFGFFKRPAKAEVLVPFVSEVAA